MVSGGLCERLKSIDVSSSQVMDGECKEVHPMAWEAAVIREWEVVRLWEETTRVIREI